MAERADELRPVVLAAALDLEVFGQQAAAGGIARHGLALGLKAEPAFTLAGGRNAQVGDEGTHPRGVADDRGNTPVSDVMVTVRFRVKRGWLPAAGWPRLAWRGLGVGVNG